MHTDTKKALSALNVEYTSCKKDLSLVREEKERLKIKVKDLEELAKLKEVKDNHRIVEEPHHIDNEAILKNGVSRM